ncbi:hypothetical protein PybrP1_003625 [[Pythium] brassicae (nom. inval.)]|nr:hypothetical protein PybrP1_003625 [[Pythium] brassicae (nom. inval.)]
MRLAHPLRSLFRAGATRSNASAAAAGAGSRRLARQLSSTSAPGLGNNPVAVARVQELADEHAVAVTWQDGFSAKFHTLWLRDHCTCPDCLHPETKQRQVDTASIALEPTFNKLEVSASGEVAIAWDDSVKGTTCRASRFDPQWLREHAYSSGLGPSPRNVRQQTLAARTLWDRSLAIPTHDFAAAMGDLAPLMTDLYKYGLVMVTATPSSMAETERFSRRIGFVLRTIYGEMWTTNPQSAEQEYNDTASTNLELLPHTDGTYMRDPPGLQIFNCVAQAGEGGESRYVDAFHAAERLRAQDPAAFRFLAATPVNYHHFDADAHLAAMEPVIKLDHAGHVVQVRYNDYDRAPLTHLPFAAVEQFYRHHRALVRVLRDASLEATLKLRVGEMVVVDNQRVLHGRAAFDGGERSLIGSYIGRNEYDSRLRVLGII